LKTVASINRINKHKVIQRENDKIFNKEVLSLNCESCKVNKKCVVYQPCNHLLSCWSCAIKTENCSKCNKEISSLLKIFFAPFLHFW